jgi:hypothetical protein
MLSGNNKIHANVFNEIKYFLWSIALWKVVLKHIAIDS